MGGIDSTRKRVLLSSLAALASTANEGASEFRSFARESRRLRIYRGPHQVASEMERRRRQRARAGLPVVEPAPVDHAACVGTDEEDVS